MSPAIGVLPHALARRGRVFDANAHEKAVFWCLSLKPLIRFRLIQDMHSSLAQQLHNFRFVRLTFLRRLFATRARLALRKAETGITASAALLQFGGVYGTDAGRFMLIENSVFDPVEVRRNGTARREKTADADAVRRPVEERKPALTLIHAGTLRPYQRVERLLEALVRVSRAIQWYAKNYSRPSYGAKVRQMPALMAG